MDLPMPAILALGFSVFLTPAVGRVGRLLGLVDRPKDELKIHADPVSVLGGVAVVGAVVAAMVVVGGRLPLAPMAGVTLALAAGLADDVRPLPAWARVAGQSAAGLVLVAGGLRLDPLGALAAAGAVGVVLACANAVNIVDGQDGLAGGTAAISAAGLALLAAGAGDQDAVALGLALAGALAGFLVWNRPPARIFLGNGGAYAVGTLLAVLATRAVTGGGWRELLAAGACLGVFAFELVFTIARRLLARERLAAGDRLHSYDLLAERMGRGAVTVLLWGLGAASVGLGLLISTLPTASATFIAAAGGVAATAFGLGLWSRRARAVRRAP
jgi:UDP-GlcNAc:undecaprenyl-phosphate/decaprenyl-phosphate GlcNAc-1-phosphate transferase